MSKRAIFGAAVVAALAVSGCTQTGTPGEGFVSKAPAATVAGEPVSCVQTTLIRNTRVWDDQTIDFVMSNGTRYRNTLPNRCPTLGFEEKFAYTTATTSLCDLDTITVLPTGSSVAGPTCGLGKFVPVTLAP
jgi:hypothetical protein